MSSAYADNTSAFRWDNFRYPIERYIQTDAIEYADNIVAFQRPSGGWSKYLQVDRKYTFIEKLLLRKQESNAPGDDTGNNKYSHKSSTLDNNATHSHIRYLLRVAQATRNKKYSSAATRGIEYILQAQYDSGGWPQNFPNTSSYAQHVTFNDGAMVGAMLVLQEAYSGSYYFISDALAQRAKLAFNHGIEYILKSQIISQGIKTAWAQQHNKSNYQPEPAREYELPAISANESVGIIKLLMSIDEPNKRIIEAVIAAISWLKSAAINNTEILKVQDDSIGKEYKVTITSNSNDRQGKVITYKGKGYDLKLAKKNKAKPIWARFYDLDSQEPIFSDWDGVKKSSLAMIDHERRINYSWYGYWPSNLINNLWPKWQNKWVKQH